MIDYKLILILILSIVLLYIYNRTETLKNDPDLTQLAEEELLRLKKLFFENF